MAEVLNYQPKYGDVNVKCDIPGFLGLQAEEDVIMKIPV